MHTTLSPFSLSRSPIKKSIGALILTFSLISVIMPLKAVHVTIQNTPQQQVDYTEINPTLTKGLWHTGQLTGALLLSWLVFEKVRYSEYNSFTKALLVIGSTPALYTLTETALQGLKKTFFPPQTVPGTIKKKIKKAVHDW